MDHPMLWVGVFGAVVVGIFKIFPAKVGYVAYFTLLGVIVAGVVFVAIVASASR